jgi:hypothetical protein
MDNNKEMFGTNIPYLGTNTEHYIIKCEKLGIIPFWNMRKVESFRNSLIDKESYQNYQFAFSYEDTIYLKNLKRNSTYHRTYSSILTPCLYPNSSTDRNFFKWLALDNSYYITNSHFLAEVLEDKFLKVLYFLGVKTDKISQYASQTVLADNFSSDNFKYFVHEDFLKTSYHCKTMRSNWVKFKNSYLKDVEREIIDDSFMDYFSSYSLPKFETLEDRKVFLRKIQSDFKEYYFTSTKETPKTKEEIDEFINSNLKLYSNIIEDQLEELSEEDMMLVAEAGDEVEEGGDEVEEAPNFEGNIVYGEAGRLYNIVNPEVISWQYLPPSEAQIISGQDYVRINSGIIQQINQVSCPTLERPRQTIREVTYILNEGIELDIEYTEDRSEGHAVQPPEEDINF